MDRKIGIVGVPIETGQKLSGLKDSPDFIRGNDLIDRMLKLGYVVSDYGNIEPVEVKDDYKTYNAISPKTFKLNTSQTKRKVAEALYQNDSVIVLGGDRTVCTGSILGHWSIDKDVCIIFVGRKPGLHTLLSSKTGDMNEMPLFLILSEMQIEIPWISDFKKLLPVISAKSIGFIGLHEVDNFEKYMINKHGIKAMSTCDIDRLGMDAVIRETLMTINPMLNKPIHLCFNIDALDPIYGPSCADGTPGGLTIRETIKLCEYLYDTGKLSVIDILELNTAHRSEKENRITRCSIIDTLMAAIGLKRYGMPAIDPNYYLWEKTNFRRGVKFKM